MLCTRNSGPLSMLVGALKSSASKHSVQQNFHRCPFRAILHVSIVHRGGPLTELAADLHTIAC